MSESRPAAVLGSGFIEITPESLEELPEEPGHFRLRSPGQKVTYAGHAGDEGLREVVRETVEGQPIAGFATVEYETTESAEEAASAAETDIDVYKPLYNEGFGRFRNSDVDLPKQGHRVRAAMRNP